MSDAKPAVILCSAIIAFCLALALVKWHFEAATFNKFKSDGTPEATIWDAAFSELRVEAQP